jgi:hypothetical protein
METREFREDETDSERNKPESAVRLAEGAVRMNCRIKSDSSKLGLALHVEIRVWLLH